MKDQTVSVNSVLDASSNSEAKKKLGQRKRTRELKSTKSVPIVYLAFLICWFSNLVINMAISFDTTYFPVMRKENTCSNISYSQYNVKSYHIQFFK